MEGGGGGGLESEKFLIIVSDTQYTRLVVSEKNLFVALSDMESFGDTDLFTIFFRLVPNNLI